jgi:CDGSH-type Zn-finger protein
MDLPKSSSLKPEQITLEKDKTYYFCSCGLTASPPFCDGAHKGTGFKSIHYTPVKDEIRWVCNCKRSCAMPFCDGTHKNMC